MNPADLWAELSEDERNAWMVNLGHMTAPAPSDFAALPADVKEEFELYFKDQMLEAKYMTENPQMPALPELTKQQKAEGAIRDIFTRFHYKISDRDIKRMLKSPQFIGVYGKIPLQKAWLGLVKDDYVYRSGKDWRWHVPGEPEQAPEITPKWRARLEKDFGMAPGSSIPSNPIARYEGTWGATKEQSRKNAVVFATGSARYSKSHTQFRNAGLHVLDMQGLEEKHHGEFLDRGYEFLDNGSIMLIRPAGSDWPWDGSDEGNDVLNEQKEWMEMYGNSENPRLSSQLLPYVKDYVMAYKHGDKAGIERARKAINRIAGPKVIPYAPTRRELEHPEMYAKIISCASKLHGKPVKRRWAVCRASQAGKNPYDFVAQARRKMVIPGLSDWEGEVTNELINVIEKELKAAGHGDHDDWGGFSGTSDAQGIIEAQEMQDPDLLIGHFKKGTSARKMAEIINKKSTVPSHNPLTYKQASDNVITYLWNTMINLNQPGSWNDAEKLLNEYYYHVFNEADRARFAHDHKRIAEMLKTYANYWTPQQMADVWTKEMWPGNWRGKMVPQFILEYAAKKGAVITHKGLTQPNPKRYAPKHRPQMTAEQYEAALAKLAPYDPTEYTHEGMNPLSKKEKADESREPLPEWNYFHFYETTPAQIKKAKKLTKIIINMIKRGVSYEKIEDYLYRNKYTEGIGATDTVSREWIWMMTEFRDGKQSVKKHLQGRDHGDITFARTYKKIMQ